MNESLFHKNEASRMIHEMIKAGINQNEIAAEIGCSRWILSLWLKKRHEPSVENYKAIVRAYSMFAPDKLPNMSTIVRKLEKAGVNIRKELDCKKGSVSNWRKAKTAPQGRYRARLVKLYEQTVGTV